MEILLDLTKSVFCMESEREKKFGPLVVTQFSSVTFNNWFFILSNFTHKIHIFFPAKHKVHTSIPKMKKKMLSIFQHPLAVLSQYIEYICVYIYYILVYTRAWIFESSIFHNFYFTHTIKQTKNKHTIFFFYSMRKWLRLFV